MPTVLRIGSYRFFFYAGDKDEPPHIHVEQENKIAKFWLDPIRLQSSGGFKRIEISKIHRIINENHSRHGMNISGVEIEVPRVENVKLTEDALIVDLSDGRTISAPLEWFPRLVHASSKERNNWRLIGRGHGIHWEDIDEDISVEGLVAGRPSGESQDSFKKWLSKRKSSLTRHSNKRRKRQR